MALIVKVPMVEGAIRLDIESDDVTLSVRVQIVDDGTMVVKRERIFSNTIPKDTVALYDSIMAKIIGDVTKWVNSAKTAINIENTKSADVRTNIEAIT